MDIQIGIAIVVACGWLIVDFLTGLRAPAQLPRFMMALATVVALPGLAFAGSPRRPEAADNRPILSMFAVSLVGTGIDYDRV